MAQVRVNACGRGTRARAWLEVRAGDGALDDDELAAERRAVFRLHGDVDRLADASPAGGTRADPHDTRYDSAPSMSRFVLLALLAGCGAAPSREPAPTPERPPELRAQDEPSREANAEAPPEVPRDEAPAPPPDEPPITIEAPPAPGAENAPAEHLEPWSLGLPIAGAGFALDDHRLVMVDGEHLTAVHGDGSTPTVRRPNPVGFVASTSDPSAESVVSSADVVFFRAQGDVFAGADRDTLRVRWQRRVRLEGEQLSNAMLHASGDAFLVSLSDELVSLDPASGEVLWRRDLPRGAVVRAGPGVVVTSQPSAAGGLTALDARTGATRWSVPRFGGDVRVLAPSGDRVPIYRDRELHVLDLADGAERAHLRLGANLAWGQNAQIEGGAIYVVVTPDGGLRYEVRRYELASGALAWRSPSFDDDTNAFHPSLGLDEDVVVACTSRLTARGVDRASGRVRWVEHPRGGCRAPRAWRPRAGAPNVLFLSRSEGSLYARGAAVVPERRARVSGRVSCDGRPAARARLWVAGRRVQADAGGRFRASVTARHAFPIEVAQIDLQFASMCLAETRWVDVAPTITADFPLRAHTCTDCI